jgi:hypothetical protein
MKSFTILVKLGQRDHMEELRSKGAVFLQTIHYFEKLENDTARGDHLEGSSEIMQPKHIGTMTLGNISFLPTEIVGPVVLGSPSNRLSNVFCMYSITKPTDLYPIDERVLAFGDSFVMVLNAAEFIRRFRTSAERMDYAGIAGRIEYFDATEYSGETGLLRKSSCFSWQNEYRLVLQPGAAEPVTLMLGDLRDIMTEVMPTREIKRRLNFGAAEVKAAGLLW